MRIALPRREAPGDPPVRKISSASRWRDPKARRRAEETVERLSSTRPGRRWHGLADFVVGPCNRVAHAAAQCVIEEPDVGANPLVIHGPVGTGKTHLLEGIFAGLKRQANTRVCFVTAEEFTTRFCAVLAAGQDVSLPSSVPRLFRCSWTTSIFWPTNAAASKSFCTPSMLSWPRISRWS